MGDEEDARETLDDLVPGNLVAEIAGALNEFPEFDLPYEAVVYEDGEIDREALAKAEAARIKSETLYGEAFVEQEVEPDEENPETVRYVIKDPTEVVRGEL